MRNWIGLVMITNAALFFYGALQHAGIAIGPFHEPLIIPAAIVETLCGVSLVAGGVAVLTHSRFGRRAALIANLVALGGVLLGMAALAAGLGPRTPSNDLYHLMMLTMIAVGLLLLWFSRLTPDSGNYRR